MVSFRNKQAYIKQQMRNLQYPNEEYINSADNKNKADLIRFRRVYRMHKHLTGRMLDIGCGDGFFLRTFPWKFSRFVGLDMYTIDQFLRGKYQENLELYSNRGKILYINGIFEETADLLNEFDFVFAGEIIEHVPDVETFLSAFFKKVKKGGCWCLTTPNNVGKDLEEHRRQFTKESLYEALRKQTRHLEIEELVSPKGSWPFLIAYGRRPRNLLQSIILSLGK